MKKRNINPNSIIYKIMTSVGKTIQQTGKLELKQPNNSGNFTYRGQSVGTASTKREGWKQVRNLQKTANNVTLTKSQICRL